MKMPVAFKSLLAVAALTAACAANASTYALPQGAPGLFQVSSNTFEDSFNFNVTSLSALVGGVGSRDLDFGFVTVQALNFSELSLTGPGLNVSYAGNAATFSATSLGVGSYTLTDKGGGSLRWRFVHPVRESGTGAGTRVVCHVPGWPGYCWCGGASSSQEHLI